MTIWRWLSNRFGGVHDFGRLSLVIHDHGVNLSWVSGMVERWRIGR
jgi:hypothetical protein